MEGRRPYERNVGLVFQDYVLFPHMTVAENVLYGMQRRGVPKSEQAPRMKRILDLVHLGGYEPRYPRQLSGGEQQRVAIARALVTEPAVLLMDEPLSNLDAKLRFEVRTEIKAILHRIGITTLIVTHDQEEAMSMSDRIIVMNKGRLLQEGTPDDIYERPADRFTADFIGRMNWIEGRLRNVRQVELDGGHAISVRPTEGQPGSMVEIGIRPERIRVFSGPAPADGCNLMPGKIASVENLGSKVHYLVVTYAGPSLLVVKTNSGARIGAPGSDVFLHFASEDCIAVPWGNGRQAPMVPVGNLAPRQTAGAEPASSHAQPHEAES
jgi:putative spermidine/putrescine transport system ATP-binding protein/putrescine transport system ATP-binding protein